MIKSLILEIIEIERSTSPDWDHSFSIGDDALRYITENDLGDDVDSYVIKFLDDADIRRKDVAFGDYQRNAVLQAINK